MAEILKARYPGIRKWQLRLFVLFVDALLSVSTLFRRKSSVKASHSKILVIRLDHIGDCIVTIPLIREVKKRFPDSTIHLLCNPEFVLLLDGIKEIDQFQVYIAPWYNKNKSGFLESIWSFFDLVKRLRNEGYDIGLDPRGDLRHILLMRFAGVKSCIGYSITGGGPLLDGVIPYEPDIHMALHSLKVMEPLTGEMPQLSYPSLPLSEDEIPVVEKIISDNLPKGIKFAGIQAAARARFKWWEPEKFARLADLIAGEGYSIVFLGSKGEREYIDGIITLCKKKHVNMAGLFTLRQLPVFLDRLYAVVGCDSGPMHISAAVGTPTLTIFGSEDPKRFRPLGDERFHKTVQKGLPCVPCRSSVCEFGDYRCLRMLSVEEVFSEFKRLVLNLQN